MKLSELLFDKAVRVSNQETLSDVIGKMQANDVSEAYILEGKEFKGVFWHEKILRSHLDIAEMKVSNAVKPVASLDENETATKAMKKMLDSDANILPYYEGKEYKGIIHIIDLMKGIETLGNIENITATEIPQLRITIGDGDKVGYAMKMMHEHHLRELPVVDEDGNLVGRINHTDLLTRYYIHRQERDQAQEPTRYTKTQTKAFHPEKRETSQLPLKDFIDPEAPLVTFSDGDTLVAIARKMVDAGTLSAFHEKTRSIITARALIERALEEQVTQEAIIRYSGFNDIHAEQRARDRIEELAEQYSEKIQQQINNELEVTLHVKESSREGKQHRYEVSIRATYPGRTLNSKNEGYDLVALIRDSFEELLLEIEHAYRQNVRETPPTDEFFPQATEP